MFIHWVQRKVLKTETGDPTLLHLQMDPVQDNVNANMFNLNLHKYMYNILCYFVAPFEPCSEKTGLPGFRPGPTQTGLYSHRRWLEA